MTQYSPRYIVDIGEPRDGELRVVALVASAQGPIVEVDGDRIKGQAISPVLSEPAIEVVWLSYIGYIVLSESYASWEDGGVWCEDGILRVRDLSHALTFIQAATWARDEYPGPLKNWEFCAENHVVCVVGTEEPIIARIPVDPAWLARNRGGQSYQVR